MPASSPTTEPIRLPLLALDLGARRIGVAVCDRGGRVCRGIGVLSRTDRHWPEKVARLAREYGCGGVVVGLPRHMDGTEGAQAADARAAVAELAKTLALPIHWQDERLSSFEAEARLRAAGLSGKKLKERLDAEAAAVILEDFLAQWRRRCAS